MSNVWCDGVQPAGTPATRGTASSWGSVVHGTAVAVPIWARTGCAAAARAAGLVEVWSTIRLLAMRGCASTTEPDFCL